eukprot:403336333
MTSSEFASEKKFIQVAKYFNKCHLRKNESPVGEYYENPYNPGDKRCRKEVIEKIMPKFIVTKPNQEPPSQVVQLQGEIEEQAVEDSLNFQAYNLQNFIPEESLQNQSAENEIYELRAYITKLENQIEKLTHQTKYLQSYKKYHEQQSNQPKPHCSDSNCCFNSQQNLLNSTYSNQFSGKNLKYMWNSDKSENGQSSISSKQYLTKPIDTNNPQFQCEEHSFSIAIVVIDQHSVIYPTASTTNKEQLSQIQLSKLSSLR